MSVTDAVAAAVPASAWLRYGRMVRIARISCRSREMARCIHIPCVVHLTVHPTNVVADIFESDLPRLRHLQLRGAGTAAGVGAALAWICAARLRGQAVRCEWDVNLASQAFADIVDAVLDTAFGDALDASLDDDTLTSPLVDVDSVRVSAYSRWPIVVSQIRALALAVTELELAHTLPNHLCFFGEPRAVFRRLRSMTLVARKWPDARNVDSAGSALSPARFPALRRLELSFDEFAGDAHLLLFFGGAWPSVTELRLRDCTSDSTLATIAERVPSLTHLALVHCPARVDIAALSASLRLLQHLELTASSNIALPRADASVLPRWSVASLTFDSDSGSEPHLVPALCLRLIASLLPALPALHSLSLSLVGVCDYSSAAAGFGAQPNTSVRHLTIAAGKHSLASQNIHRLIDRFSSLKQLTLRHASKDDRVRLQLDYPHIRVTSI
ncbi:hypothetical protein GQ42DRAFT_178244 [Ramicandelaber brevisporus]|nr:hypothetical protein GQ42DRAFT_178244 [Ramicandelaber brevisporus]